MAFRGEIKGELTMPHEKKIECPVAIGKTKFSRMSSVVDELCQTNTRLVQRVCNHGHDQALPSKTAIVGIMEDLRAILFPGYFGISRLDMCSIGFHVGSLLDKVLRDLQEQILRGLCFVCSEKEDGHCRECAGKALEITHEFLEMLPAIQKVLASDVHSAYKGDPAATSPDEAIFCYPGIVALTNYRVAHALYKLGVPLIPRMITEHAHGITGIDIHPGAEIGDGFFIDHGTGIVIGETSIIGRNVSVYQGVTLGAKSFPMGENGIRLKTIPRHPIVEDDVIIYSGATILGRVTIGKGSVIGGNVWLTESVPPGSRVLQSGFHTDRFEDGDGI
jgi:serine O-acetyltransferase